MNFSATIQHWYRSAKRDLPWRQTSDPYAIWVSEIILQQTRVAQGLDYYLRFIQHFPTVTHLANAPEQEVLRIWQGLGYYSRARNMQKAAQACQGHFPSHYEDLLALPGIGDYTASAISSFAAGECHATVDGNVYRVLARLFDWELPVDSTQGIKQFKALAEELLDKQHPGNHNQAFMEFGAIQCIPSHPPCEQCPCQTACLAYAHGTVEQRPVKKGKTHQRTRHLYYLDVHQGDTRYMQRRTGKDIWQGLYEFPLLEQEHEPTLEDIQQLLAGCQLAIGTWGPPIKHVLSHQILWAHFIPVEIIRASTRLECYQAITDDTLRNYPIPRLIEKYINKKG